MSHVRCLWLPQLPYLIGKTAIRTLLSPHYQKLKKVPPVKDEDEAKALMVKLLPLYVFFSLFPSFFLFPAYCETKSAFFLRTDRPVPETPIPSGQPKPLRLSPQQSFDPLAYYTWFYDGSPLYTYLGGLAMVLIMLAGVMFPLWPVKLRIGVWYLSVGVLGLIGAFLGLAVVRLVFWCVTVLTMKRAIWIFPNLFEDVGFVSLFFFFRLSPLLFIQLTSFWKNRSTRSSPDGITTNPKRRRRAVPTPRAIPIPRNTSLDLDRRLARPSMGRDRDMEVWKYLPLRPARRFLRRPRARIELRVGVKE